MRIYVDFDDVLCETARSLSRLAGELYGCRVAYADIRVFDLRDAFLLAPWQYHALMARAHEDDVLRGLRPTPGAVATILEWVGAGHDVQIVTGRPFATRGASLAWLSDQGLSNVPLVHVDKYGREAVPSAPAAPRSLTLAEFSRLRFDLAIEDAPEALRLLRAMPDCRTIIYDRPWNRGVQPSPPAIERCLDWQEVAELARTPTAVTAPPSRAVRQRAPRSPRRPGSPTWPC
ncbi:MAG: 2-dehydropantoate 2-reductase [Kiritimatiellae bacterium]|nr:2-dehydropantoate 2-reductase [Kiritimatiellia bacterium]